MPSIPEYNALPLDRAGEVTLKVRFADKADKGRQLPTYKMSWSDLSYFFDEVTKAPHPQLYFDDYLLPVQTIEILPASSTVFIVVGPVGLETIR